MNFKRSRKFAVVSVLVLTVLALSSFAGSMSLPLAIFPASSAASTPAPGQPAHQSSAPSAQAQGYSGGTVYAQNPIINSHIVKDANGFTYVTNFGNYTFKDSSPWIVSFENRAGQLLSPESMFSLNSSASVSNPAILVQSDSIYSIEYALTSGGNLLGNMTLTYNFDYEPVNGVPLKPKITINFAPSVGSGPQSVSWIVIPVDQFIQGDSVHSSVRGIGNIANEVNGVGKDGALLIGPSLDSSQWAKERPGGVLYVNWADSGSVPKVDQGLLSVGEKGVAITFPVGLYNIDPTLSSTSGTDAVDGSSQRKTFYSDGLFWAFFAASGWIEYSTSANGSVFTAPANTSIAAQNGKAFSVYNNNASVMYLAVANYASSGFYKEGLLGNNGTVTWTTSTIFTGGSGDVLSMPQISISGANVFVTVFADSSGSSHYYLYENGALIQALPATSLTGQALGNPSTSTAYISNSGSCTAEEFIPATTGTVNQINFYVDVANIGTFYAGIYNSTTLLASGSTTFSSNTNAEIQVSIPTTTVSGGQAYWLAVDTKGGGAGEYWYASSSSGGTGTWGGCSNALPTSTPNFGNSNNYLQDLWAPINAVNQSTYQTPIALPLSQNYSYFLYGTSSGSLEGETFNATTKAAPVTVQTAQDYPSNYVTTITFSFGSSTTAGDEIVLVTAGGNNNPNSVTDSQSNSYSELSQKSYSYSGSVYYSSVWGASTSSSSSDSITVKFPSTSTADVYAYEVKGLASASTASFSTGSGVTGSNYQASVSSYLPSPNSFVSGIISGCDNNIYRVSAGQDYTLASGIASAYYGSSEYNSSWLGGSTNTVFGCGASGVAYAEISAAFPPENSGFSSSVQVAQNLTSGDNVASAVPLNGKIYLAYLQSDTNGLYSIIYKSYSGTAWSSPTIIQSGITYPVHPAISINNATGDVYVFWAGYPQLNHVYYDFYNATSTAWSPVVQWLNATDFTPSDGMGYSSSGSFQSISVSPYAANGRIGAIYETGLSSPYEIQYSVLVDPPSPFQTSVYNAMQASQDYLTRLEKNSAPSSSLPSGDTPVYMLSEYPALPLMADYSDGCIVPAQNGGQPQNGGYNSQCSLQATLITPTISTVNSLGTTSENYTYVFTSPDDTSSVCGGVSGSPKLQVVVTWYGLNSSGPDFQYIVNAKVLSFDDTNSGCSVSLYLGNQSLTHSSYITNSTSGEYAYSGDVQTYPKGGGGVNWGFDFNPFSGPGVTPNSEANAFRYTTRSGLQAEWKWALSAQQDAFYGPVSGSGTALWSSVQNELYGATQPFTVQDIYTPQWFYGATQPWNFEDNSSTAGGPYTDCNSNNQPGNLPNGLTAISWAYPYASKVCSVGAGTYLSQVWGADPLVMGETAIQVLLQDGPNDSVIPWEGVNMSPTAFASALINSQWYNSTYGIAYPKISVSCLYMCPNTAVYSGDRTPVIAELLTLLAYKYGDTAEFKTPADTLMNIVLKTQWGMDTSPANNGCLVGCGVISNSGSPADIFRPQNTGGQILGWNTNWQFINPQSGFSGMLDLLNMPSEYLGWLPTDQEATQCALAALAAYFNFAIDPVQGTANPGINTGAQPFYNYMIQNSVGATGVASKYTRTFSLNDIFASGQMAVNLTLVNEGDGYNRPLTVWLQSEGSTAHVIEYTTVQVTNAQNTTNNPTADKVYHYNIPVGDLQSTETYNLTISLPSYDYSSTGDWWLVSASLARYEPIGSVSGSGSLTVSASVASEQGLAPFNASFSSVVNGGTSPYTYSWIFGDGGTSTLADPYHVYTTPGVYTPSVNVQDSVGDTASYTGSDLEIYVVQGATCKPTTLVGTFSLSVSTITNGVNATATNNSCQTLAPVMWFVVTNSVGQVYLISSSPLGSIASGGKQWASLQLGGAPSGTYTFEVFVWMPDGVPVSLDTYTSVSVS